MKVLFRDGEFIETLWAERVDGDAYRVDNSPFYAYGVSWRDVVEAHPDSDGQLVFSRIVEKSGHKTIRINFDVPVNESPASRRILDGLLALGASYEGMRSRYFSVDIPPAIELGSITRYLTERGAQWEYADPRYSEIHPHGHG